MNKTKLLSFLVASFSIFGVTSCAKEDPKLPEDNPSGEHEEERQEEHEEEHQEDHPEAFNDFILTKVADNFDIHNEKQLAYIKDSYLNVAAYANGQSENSYSNTLKLEWDYLSEDYKGFSTFKVELDTDSNFSDPWIYETRNYSTTVSNLEIGATYSWRVNAVYKDKTVTSAVSTFTTANTLPRNMYVDGVTNMRDLGGYSLSNGKKVKQGLVYRCARLDSSSTTYITGPGKIVMNNYLKIKSEIDLRNDATQTVSCLGSNVDYYFCGMEYQSFPAGKNMATANAAEVKKVFRIFANEESYPLIYHCNIGTDRTGMVSVLLSGLLGVSMEDITKDYLFSNFGNIGGSRVASGISEYVTYIQRTFEGSTFSEQVENFLINEIGITSQEIASIKSILIT